ncbi:putative glutamine synthetase [Rhodovulum sulfidophilum]|uniref:Putative glutamine synthetase n=1 Tax=Rhodovulum sulfidophilum TaxID=35806 RepID=A0A0D6B4R9_RHOSU|nr:putative glutamine synthetase [Rhodovulum sulfidophilum]
MPGPMCFDELTVAVTGDRIDRLAFCLMNMRGQLMGRRITARPVVDTARADPQCRPHMPGTDPEMSAPDGYAAMSRRAGCGDDRMRPPLRAAGLPVGKPKGAAAQKAPGRQRRTCPPVAAEGRPPCHLCTEAPASGRADHPSRRSDRLRRALRQQRQALRQGPGRAGNDGPVGLPCPTGAWPCGENTPPARTRCRIAGPDIAPRLAPAGRLAAGLKDIAARLELDPEGRDDIYETANVPDIPNGLRDATETPGSPAMLREEMADVTLDQDTRTAEIERKTFDQAAPGRELTCGYERAQGARTVFLRKPAPGSYGRCRDRLLSQRKTPR